MKKWLERVVALSTIMLVAIPGMAVEPGRHVVDPGTIEKNYTEVRIAQKPGVDLGWDLNIVDWNIGRESFRDQAGSPSVALFYGVNEALDLRASIKYMGMEDATGTSSSDFSAFRMGFGTRWWIPTQTDFYPYAGVLLNYYFMDDNERGTADGALGGCFECGISYLIQNSFMVRAGLGLETTILDGQVMVQGTKEDVSLSSVSIGVGLLLLF